MKIRTKLIMIATIPVALLLILTYVFLAATNAVDHATNRAIIADELSGRLADLTILTYEHHIYFEERAHTQWHKEYESLGKQLQEQAQVFDTPRERDIVDRLLRVYHNIGYLFEQYGPHAGVGQADQVTEQVKSFRNRITARLLQELAVAAPAAKRLHELNRSQATVLSQRIDVASVLVVGFLALSLLVISTLVIRAFTVPVRLLNEAFDKLSAGDLGFRVNSQSHDELGVLSRAFDLMSQRLKESSDSLRVMNLDLERRVNERTVELSRANDELTGMIEERLASEQALRLNEERLAALLDLTQGRFATEADLVRYSLEEAVRLTRSKVGYLHFFDEANQTLGLYQWSQAVLGFCTAAKTPHYPLREAGVWADCVRQRQPVVHNDYPNLANKKGYPEGHFPLFRHMSLPIFDDEERIVAVLGVGNKEEPYGDADIRQLTLYMASTWQIIKRKRIEFLLHESEKRYRTIFNESPDGIVIIDMESGRAVEFNDVAHRQLGYSREEFARLTVVDYEAKEQPEQTQAHVEAIRRLGREDFETLHRTKGGSIRNVLVSAQALAMGERQYIYAIYRDITELRQSQEENIFKAKLLDASSDSIFLVNPEGRVVYVNEAAYTSRGYRQDEIIGMALAELDAPEFVSLIGPRIQRVFEKGEAVFESAHRCRDGSVMPVEVHARAFEQQGAKMIISSIRDISERKQSEEVLKRYALSLERSNKELEHFAYVASHDLQEPLRKIGSFTELLAKKYHDRLDEKADTYIGYIVDGAHRMQILINDLLSFSRVTTNGKAFAPVDCNEVLARVQRDLELAIKESGARLVVGELPTVMADDVQLGQVLQNLITNAIKYRDPGLSPEIRIGVKMSGDEWVFSVQDNGIGIAPEHFDRVFQLFQRLHTREEYSGTGIGLALCKKIVERHGGHIWVESEPGQGATFFFTIPM